MDDQHMDKILSVGRGTDHVKKERILNYKYSKGCENVGEAYLTHFWEGNVDQKRTHKICPSINFYERRETDLIRH